ELRISIVRSGEVLNQDCVRSYEKSRRERRRRYMPEGDREHCERCGAKLLPRRRFCIVCMAQIPGVSRPLENPSNPSAEKPSAEGQLAGIMRQLPSTHQPDKTIIFVPEMREARLKRERRNRRALIAAMISCAVLAIAGFTVWRVRERKQTQAQSQGR